MPGIVNFPAFARGIPWVSGLEGEGGQKETSAITCNLAICPTIDDNCRFEGTRHHHMDLKTIALFSHPQTDSG